LHLSTIQDSHQGGHKLLHLPTNKIVTQRNLTPLPITKSILNYITAIVTNKGMPIDLKIHSKSDSLLYDLAWIEFKTKQQPRYRRRTRARRPTV
jgi:hypothetical protein